MKTIFAYNPTQKELLELTGKIDTSEKVYLLDVSSSPVLDIALLLDSRGLITEAKKYWDQIPELALQYKLGFDELLIPVK